MCQQSWVPLHFKPSILLLWFLTSNMTSTQQTRICMCCQLSKAGGSLEGTAGAIMEHLGRQELPGVRSSSQACQAGDTVNGAQLPETRPALRKPVIRPRVRKILFNTSGAGGQDTGAGEALHQSKQLTAADQQAETQSKKEQESCKGVLSMEAPKTTSRAGSPVDTTAKPVMKRAVQSVFSFL